MERAATPVSLAPRVKRECAGTRELRAPWGRPALTVPRACKASAAKQELRVRLAKWALRAMLA
jgi:hypothetical protein